MRDPTPSYDELLTIYENVLDGICVIDAHAVILSANPAFAHMTGYSTEELAGKAIHQIIDLDPVHDLRSFTDQIHTKLKTPLERNGVRKNGTTYIAEVHGTFSSYEDQPVLITIVRDITDRKQRAEQFRQSRERLSLVVQQSPMAIITWDTQFRVNQWNLAAEEIFGHSTKEAMGQHARLIIPENAHHHVDQVWESLMTMQGGRRSTNENITRDGRTILCEWYNAPLVDADGHVIGVLSLVEDVTEQKQLEAERERLMSAIQQTDDSVLITNQGAVIQYVNPAFEKVTGYTLAEIRGQNARILKSGMHDEAFYRDMWQTLASGRSWKADITNRCKDGSLVTENVSISPIVDASGTIVSYVSVRRDVTRLRSIEEQLVQGQKMEAIGRLAGGVAHDFNNMLSVILGYTELILPKLQEGDSFARELQEIDKAARRSADLTRQLLAFSRKQIIEPKVMMLNHAVADMQRTLARLIGEDIQLEFRPAEKLWNIKIDPSQVDQILANLAANARDAMPDGGRLLIETANVSFDESTSRQPLGIKPGEFVRLAVSDTGDGMDANTRSHIFEPFFTTKQDHRGTGLGLATVQGIVSQNDGFVLVESERGVGTIFSIHLPRSRESSIQLDLPTEQHRPVVTETVLLVEDDEMVRNLTCDMLRRMGYTVLIAQSALEALDVFEKHAERIDLLLTDVVMPGSSGRELQATLVEQKRDLKTLFMSGYTADIISHRGILEHGVNFIQKPFGIEELSEKMRESIDGSKPPTA